MKYLTIIFTFLITITGHSQESILDKIAQKTCEYMDSEEIINLGKSEKTIKLGVFIIGQYGEYKEELLAEGIDIDFSEENAGRRFGEKVGLAMMNFCPNALIALADDKNSEEGKDIVYETFSGNITSINGDDFSFVQVENSDGIVQNFLWLSNFKGSEKLMSNVSHIGTKVKIKYKNTECFSPKLKEYINRKEIVEIEYLD